MATTSNHLERIYLDSLMKPDHICDAEWTIPIIFLDPIVLFFFFFFGN